MKEPARWARRKSVTVDYAATIVETAQLLVMRDPILIYSIGKVGTTALTASIESATGRPVMKAHGLTREGLRVRLERERQITERPRGIWANQWLQQDLRLRRKHAWQVVTGVRDPIAIATSAYFYTLRLRHPSSTTTPINDDISVHGHGVAEIIERFTRREDWFRDEFEPVTGIDVYADRFPTEVGFRQYVRGRFHVLLLRQEDLRRVGGAALGGFFDLDGPCPILERNTGEGDPLYARFLREWRFPESLVSEAYDTRLSRHFYSGDELAEMKRRWSA